MTKVEPYALKGEMEKRISFDTDLETDVKAFIKMIKEDAVAFQRYYGKPSAPPTQTKSKLIM